MTVAKARVAGGWVPLSTGSAGQVWNTAWGTVATGSLIAATSIPVGVTKITSDIVFKSVPGRRYRFVLQVRIVGATTGNGVNFLPLGPGVGGATWDTWVTTAVWAPLYTEVLFTGNDTSGNFYWNANNAGTGAVQVYFDSMSCVYIEDIGPVTGFTPVTPAVAWTPIPLSGNWLAYDPGGGWQVPSYRKIGDIVYCRGLAKNASNDLTVGVLPVGYRPTGNVMTDRLALLERQSGTGTDPPGDQPWRGDPVRCRLRPADRHHQPSDHHCRSPQSRQPRSSPRRKE